MCGRFVLLTDLAIIKEAFHIREVAGDYRTGGNICPGQSVMAVVAHESGRRLAAYGWGLIPAWAKDPAIGRRMFNARQETVAEKPSFRDAFKKRRCLILADGFYEWQSLGRGPKKPWYIFLKSGRPFGFAGLYETWTPPGGSPVSTCTIITTTPNELIEPLHNRMPVILTQEAEEKWLDPGYGDARDLHALLQVYPADEMACRPEDPERPR